MNDEDEFGVPYNTWWTERRTTLRDKAMMILCGPAIVLFVVARWRSFGGVHIEILLRNWRDFDWARDEVQNER